MADSELAELATRHGMSSKLVRAVCAAMGWRHQPGDNGAPREWYEAFRGWLGDALERIAPKCPDPGSKKRPR